MPRNGAGIHLRLCYLPERCSRNRRCCHFRLCCSWSIGGSADVSRRDAAPLVPFFALGISLASITVWQEQNLGADGADWSLTFVERMLVAGRALWFYAGKIFWPHPLAFYYPRWTIDASAWWQYAFPVGAVAAILGFWALRHRIGRGPLAAVLIFAGVLAPTLGFFKIYFQLFSYVANHFQYHASPALIALVVAAAATAWSKYAARLSPEFLIRIVGGTALLIILALTSFRAASVLRDEETLNLDAIAKNPDCWIAYSHLAVRLCTEERFEEALEASQNAMRLAPTRPRVPYNTGKILMDRGERDGFRPGDLDEAIASFDLAGRLNPTWAPPNVALGRALIRANRYDEAKRCLNRGLQLDPENVDALCSMGFLWTEAEKWTDAQSCYEKATQLQPSRPEAHYGLGLALTGNGQLTLAAEQFSEAVRLRPAYSEAWNNLGITRARLGEIATAVDCFREALRWDPDSLQAQANLSKALDSRRQGAARD